MSDIELVSVMVPKRHLSAVYGFIARLDGAPAEAEGASPPSPPTPGIPDDWTSSRVQRMVRESPEAMRDMLQAMADRAGEWVTVHELAGAIKANPTADWNTVAGTMGAFGRRLKNRYGINKKPFEKRYDHGARCKVFRMSKEMAAQIIRAMDNDPS